MNSRKSYMVLVKLSGTIICYFFYLGTQLYFTINLKKLFGLPSPLS